MKHAAFLALLISLLSTLNLTAQPATQPSTQPFSDWSPTVNGLSARIASPDLSGSYIFLEIRNAGNKPLNIPSLQIKAAEKNFPWRLEALQGIDWKDIPWSETSDKINSPTSPVLLQPGQTALLWFINRLPEDRQASQFRLILNQFAAGPIENWTGQITTPPVAAQIHSDASKSLANTQTAPDYFPALIRYPLYFSFINAPDHNLSFEKCESSNSILFNILSIYKDTPIRLELEKCLANETSLKFQLILALQAAQRGSDKARDFLLAALEDLDDGNFQTACEALIRLARTGNPPDWVQDALIAVLKENRLLNGTLYNQYLFNGFIWSLGDLKCRRACPLLLDIAQKGNSSAIETLGQLDDPAAIPPLLEIAKSELAKPEKNRNSTISHSALQALITLKAPGIADLLLDSNYDNSIIFMLAQIKDPRVIPVLQQVIQTGKYKDVKLDNYDIDIARVAIVMLEEKDPTDRLCQLATDMKLSSNVHYDAISRLAHANPIDPKIVPTLLKAAKQHPDDSVGSISIRTLGAIRHPSAVSGLIDLFNADFSKVKPMKTDNVIRDIHTEIARSLSTLTNQSFGIDANAWKQWWSTQDPSKFK